MVFYQFKRINQLLLILGIVWLPTIKGYADDSATQTPDMPINSSVNEVVTPQQDALQSTANSPTDLVNPSFTTGKNDLNKSGIYSMGGKLLIDRSVKVLAVNASSATFSTATVTNSFITSTTTVNGNLTVNGNTTINGVLTASINVTGRILQVVISSTTGSTTVTGTSYGATKLSQSITPSSVSSHILVLVSGNLRNSNNAGAIAMATVFRGSTDLSNSATAGLSYANNGSSNQDVPCSMLVYDAPATTSSTTYTVKIKSDTAGVSALWDTQGSASQMLLIEVL